MKVINNNVIHFEDEKLVGLVLDYKQAAIVTWLLGSCSGSNPTSRIFNDLLEISEVEVPYEEIMDEFPDTNFTPVAPNFKEWYSR